MSKLISRWISCLNSEDASDNNETVAATAAASNRSLGGGASSTPRTNHEHTASTTDERAPLTSPRSNDDHVAPDDGPTVMPQLSPGGLDVATAEVDARRFAILARNRCVDGLDYASEGVWRGPFCFLQAADTQLGMMDDFDAKTVPAHWNGTLAPKEQPRWDAEIRLMQQLVRAANALRPRPRFLVVCGDLVDAMPGVSYKADQVRDYKAVLASLDESIRPVCVCGNHDVGDIPTPAAVGQFAADFGDDYYAFWTGGVKFLTVNSQFYHDDSLVCELANKQAEWLDGELSAGERGNKPWKHLIGFQHIPPFIDERNEDPVLVFGNSKLFFNFGDRQKRFAFLDKLKTAGMTKLFCGHYHRNAGGWDDTLEVVVTSAVGCQLGGDRHGCRLVVVGEHDVQHRYFALDDLPERISLDAPFAEEKAS